MPSTIGWLLSWCLLRLDVPLRAYLPDSEYLCTDAAKGTETIYWAYKRSIIGVVPDNVLGTFVI